MTYEADCTLPEELLEQIAQQGLDVLPDVNRTVINTAMQIERQYHLNAAPYERTAERRGRANGYKPKTVTTRVGQVTFDVPQVREGGFCPQSLEKGLRSAAWPACSWSSPMTTAACRKRAWLSLAVFPGSDVNVISSATPRLMYLGGL